MWGMRPQLEFCSSTECLNCCFLNFMYNSSTSKWVRVRVGGVPDDIHMIALFMNAWQHAGQHRLPLKLYLLFILLKFELCANLSRSLSLTNTEYNNVVTIIGKKNGKQIKVRQKMTAYFSWFMSITSCESFICESCVETIDSTAVVSKWWAKHP